PRPASGGRELQSERWMSAAQAEPTSPNYAAPPSGRGIGAILLRIGFGILWIAAFFVIGSFSISAVAMALENGDQEARQKAAEAAGQAYGVPLFFGSILLVVVLAIVGWLPGFRRRKVASVARDEALPRSKPSDSRLIVGR